MSAEACFGFVFGGQSAGELCHCAPIFSSQSQVNSFCSLAPCSVEKNCVALLPAPSWGGGTMVGATFQNPSIEMGGKKFAS